MISQAAKSRMRGQLELAQKDLAGAKNRQMMMAVDAGIAKVKEVRKFPVFTLFYTLFPTFFPRLFHVFSTFFFLY